MRGIFARKRGAFAVMKCGVSVLLVLSLILGDFGGGAPEEARATSAAWDGTAATPFAGGDGSAADPYQIADGAPDRHHAEWCRGA